MKKLCAVAMLCLLAFTGWAAGYKISDLQQTNTVGGSEWIELDQGGVKSWKINAHDFWAALGTNGSVTIISVTTNVNNYSFTTNQVVYETNVVNVQITTNLTVYQTNVANYTITTNLITYQTNVANYFITTNQITYETNIANYFITTNQITYETNINNVLITTNLYVYETNIVNQTITTNLTVYQTNLVNQTITTNLTVYETNISNWIISTNVITYETNYVNYSYTTNLTVNNIAQVKTMYVTNLTVVNSLDVPTDGHFGTITVTNNSYFYGPALSYSMSASNAPAENELPTAHWVRSLFNNGLILYNTTNVYTQGTNASEGRPLNAFTNTIPEPARKHYPAVNLNDYIGSVIATNRFQFLQGPVLVHAFLEMTNGLGSPSVSVHPELYYSYDGTNWQGDWIAQNQAITTGTNLYEWVISFPAVTSTNSTGFLIQRRFKVGAVGGATHPGVVVHVGTNYLSGTNDAGHISISGNTVGGGGTVTGGPTTNYGVLVTNVAYITNLLMDFSGPWNAYVVTNVLTNHFNICPTNLVQGGTYSLAFKGAAAYTNFNVWLTPPDGSWTFINLSITNGSPTTTITSNKWQWWTFTIETNNSATNVPFAFKEQP